LKKQHSIASFLLQI